MFFLALVLIIFLLFHYFHLPTVWMTISQNTQNLCIQKIPPAEFHDFMTSLVCGKDLSNSAQLSVLLSTQLYHMVVVSGGHLQVLLEFLEIFAKKTFFGKLIIIAVLILFSTFTGLQAPVTRSLFVFLLNQLYLNFKIKSHPDLIQLASGVLCLLLFPDWIYSYSLFLSWWAGLSLCLSFQIINSHSENQWKETLWKVSIVQLSTGLALGIFSGLGILTNWLIAPLFGFILFPIALVSLIAPVFSNVFDFISTYFFSLLSFLNNLSNLNLTFEGLSKMGLTPWFCLAIFNSLLHFFSIHQMREKCS